MSAPDQRLYELDGIRGWAALSVICHHIFWAALQPIVPIFRNRFVAFAIDGPLAVYVFFVLSGMALSFPVIRRNGAGLTSMILKRYPRLAFPVLVSTLITFAAMISGLVYSAEATSITHDEWTGGILNFSPSLSGAFVFGLRSAFSGQPPSYNNFLWTMPIELSGSILVFCILSFYPRVLNRIAFSAGLCVVIYIFDPNLFGFAFGMSLASAEAAGLLSRMSDNRLWKVLNPLVIAITAIAATEVQIRFNPFPGTRFNSLAAAVLVAMVMTNSSMRHFFRTRLSRFLGAISFPIYLTHFVVIASFTSYMIVISKGAMTLSEGLVVGFASVAISIFAACCFYPIEQLSHEISKRIARLVIMNDHLPSIISTPPSPATSDHYRSMPDQGLASAEN